MKMPATDAPGGIIGARVFPKLLARRFADRQIRYCYVRWDMASWRQGQDIDVMLPEEQLDQACDVLLALAEELGAIVVNINAYRGRRHVMVAINEPDWTHATLIEFDLQTYVVEGNVLLASARYLVDHAELRESIQWPRGAVDAVFRLLRGILRRGVIKEEDWWFIRRVVAEQREEFVRHLSEIIGANLAGVLAGFVAEDAKTELLATQAKLVRARLELAPSARVREEKGFGTRLWRRLRGTIRPPGEFICLMGTDGAGKTTVGRQMASLLAAVPYAVKYEYCGVGGGGGQSTQVWVPPVTPAAPPSRGRLGRLKQILRPSGKARKFWVPLRVMCGLPREFWHYLVEIHPTLARGGVVIGDRYYFDSIANLYEDLPPWFIRLVARTFPGPTLVVHLYNAPEVIHRRKQEKTRDQIERDIRRLRRLQPYILDWRERLTDRPANQIAWQLLGELMRIRTQRQLEKVSV